MDIAETVFPILVILALGIMAAVLSRMAKVNPIVGYLVLGVLVSAVRPELLSAGGTVHLLAELGVVFLLFDIGLHFSTAHVRHEAGNIFGFGPLQVSASTIVIGLCAWALGLPPVGAFIVGATLSLSSTAIVAGVIAERRQQNCPVALTATAILIFQDVAAIFLLILTTSLESGAAVPAMFAALVKTIVAVAVALLAARFIVRPLFVILSRHGGEEVFTATALLIALAAGWSAAMAGLSMTLGAFLGGMMVAESPFKASVRSEIGPFRGLLVSFFFLSVGASLDMAVIARAWPAIIAISLAMILLKSIANIVSSLTFRWSVPGSVQLGVLLAGGSEFAFIVLAMPGVRDAVGDAVVADLIAAVALTLALTPALGFIGRNVAGRLRMRATLKMRTELVPRGKTNPVLIVGMGEVGRTIADALEAFDIGYDAIERDGARLRSAVADGYNASFGDAADARLWRALDLGGRQFSVMTDASIEAARDWMPSSLALFPNLHRLWVTETDDEAEQLNELGIEAVVSPEDSHGLEAAQALLMAFGISPEAASAWTDRQRARIASPLAA
ncbi:cation:proton antiporter domain-containing protein [Sphingomonas sp. PR090111-T3T-6A]|uniref:cation:proton antiporter domain-containing protein n=1 Tax=Sphingomonas sp. PR090111-T3T-6A TaxID=685778 RepID=UPI000371F448|nr:cation:proton antiporter [Sphingomonas sp. PR090111-T3T-6A]